MLLLTPKFYYLVLFVILEYHYYLQLQVKIKLKIKLMNHTNLVVIDNF